MSAARPGDAGLVSGLFNTTQQVGMALGVAVLSTLAAARTAQLAAAAARRAAAALTGGYQLAFAVGAGLAAGGARRGDGGAAAGRIAWPLRPLAGPDAAAICGSRARGGWRAGTGQLPVTRRSHVAGRGRAAAWRDVAGYVRATYRRSTESR